MGPSSCRIGLIRFLAGWRKRQHRFSVAYVMLVVQSFSIFHMGSLIYGGHTEGGSRHNHLRMLCGYNFCGHAELGWELRLMQTTANSGRSTFAKILWML